MSPRSAYLIALVDKDYKPDPAIESCVATEAKYSFNYAFDIIRGRWEPGEAIIATDAKTSYWYARYIVQDRWKPGEAVIAENPNICDNYIKFVLKINEKYKTDPDFMAFLLAHG